MFSTVLRLVTGLAVVYLVATVLAWRYQDRLAFPAPRRTLPAPDALGIPDGELVQLTTRDGVTLFGWFLPAGDGGGGPSPGLLWFYGNMETVADLAPVIRYLRPPGTAMLIVDYRGYGQSDGAPTEPGLYRDADAAWTYLMGRPEVDRDRVGVYGRSLGSAVALYLATQHPVRTVILDSPFSSAGDMARLHYWFFPRFLVRHELDNVGRARELRSPLMVFHGTEDRIAPVEMGRAVAEAGHAREFVLIEDAGHNDTYDFGGARYREKLHEFLGATLQ